MAAGSGVTHQDAALAEALGAGRADVVGAQHLDHRGAHQAGDDGDLRQRERDDGQGEVVETHSPEIETGYGEPTEPQSEDQRQQRTGDEGRYRNADHGDAHGGIVRSRVLPHGGGDPEANASEKRDRDGESADGKGDGQALGQEFRDVLVLVLHRRAEIACNHIAQVFEVLLMDRLIEAEAGAHVGFDFGGQLAVDGVGVAGRGPHQEEGDGDYGQHGGDGGENAPRDVGPGNTRGEARSGRRTYLVRQESLRPARLQGYKTPKATICASGRKCRAEVFWGRSCPAE